MRNATIRPDLESLETILSPTTFSLVLSSATLAYTPSPAIVAATSTAIPPTVVPKDPGQLQNIANQLPAPPDLSIPQYANPVAPITSTPAYVPPTNAGTIVLAGVSMTTTATGAASVVAPVVAQQGTNIAIVNSPLLEDVSW